MVRLGLRLMLVLMGGVLLVTTLGIGWRRYNTVHWLLILQRRGVGLVVYDPESKYQWPLGYGYKTRYLGLDDAGRFVFVLEGQRQGIFSRGLFDQQATQLSIHTPNIFRVRWTPDHHWLIYCEGEIPDFELYALRMDGKVESQLGQNLPPNFAPDCPFGRFVVDKSSVIFAGVDGYLGDVYRVQMDGSGLENLTTQLPPAYIANGQPSHGEIIFIIEDQAYRYNLTEGKYFPLLTTVQFERPILVASRPNSNRYIFATDFFWDLAAVDRDGRLSWQKLSSDLWPWSGGSTILVGRNNPTMTLYLLDILTGATFDTQFPIAAEFRHAWSPDGSWVVFNAPNPQSGQEELWKLNVITRKIQSLWGPHGADIFDLWVSPDGQEILVDAATPTWAGLLRLNPDGTNPRELTNVQDMELGEHDFVDWATLPDHSWQPFSLGGAGGGLLLVGLGWPLIRRLFALTRVSK